MSKQKLIRSEAHHWRSKIDDGGLTEAEHKNFENWLAQSPEHIEAYAEAEIVWGVLGAAKTQLPLSSYSQNKGFARYKHAFLSWLFSPLTHRCVLACLAFTVFAWVMLAPSMKDNPTLVTANHSLQTATSYQGSMDKITRITLDDMSEVTLGRSSEIEVSIKQNLRSVTLLRGSAYFDVQHDDRPFVIVSGGAEVKVLGTRFDLQRKGDVLYLAVEEGAVSVAHAFPKWSNQVARVDDWLLQPGQKQSKILTAGQGIKISKRYGLETIKEIDTTQLAAWRDDRYIYENVPLGEIVTDLQRLTAQPIQIDDKAAKLSLTGTFNSEQFEQMVSAIEAVLPVRIIKQPRQWLIEAQ